MRGQRRLHREGTQTLFARRENTIRYETTVRSSPAAHSERLGRRSCETRESAPKRVIQSRRSRVGGRGGWGAAEDGEETQNARPAQVSPCDHADPVRASREHASELNHDAIVT